MTSVRDIHAMLDRAAARLAEIIQDCHLCGTRHPNAREHERETVRCTGCGATFRRYGCWHRIITAEDADNPYLAAFYIRRYGHAPAGMRVEAQLAYPPEGRRDG